MVGHQVSQGLPAHRGRACLWVIGLQYAWRKRVWALLLEWGPQGTTTIEGRIMKALVLMQVTHSPNKALFQDLWFNPN